MSRTCTKMSPFQCAVLIGTVLFLVTTGAAQAQEPQSYDPGAAAMGRSSFKSYCASCHGPAAKGDGPLAEDLRTTPADLTGLTARNDGEFPLDMVLQVVDGRKSVSGHGSADMPAWGDVFSAMTDEDQAKRRIEQIANFLWSVQETAAP